MTSKKSGGKVTTPRKGQPGSEGNLHKRLESDRISTDIADFEKSGGRVEKLGVTWVLQKIEPAPKGGKVPAVKPAERTRKK